MEDRYGRTIDYMRISITDRCNLRCKYCMPDGVTCGDRWDMLSLEEIQTIAYCGAKLGIRHVKITGGEPLVRRDCCRLVEMLKGTAGIEKVTITTNGVLLESCWESLLAAGIDGINISLDTLDRELYQRITGQDELEQVLRMVRMAADSPVPVKVNAVSVDFGRTPGFGKAWERERDWQPLVELARDKPVDVRFIEMMPVGYGRDFVTRDHQQLLKELRQEYPGMERDERIHGFGPAVYYQIPGFAGSIGLISALHGKFCDRCNRVRLTAQGQLKTCLCYDDGVDLRGILRQGEARPSEDVHAWRERKPVEEDSPVERRLMEAMRQAIREKPAAHCFERPEQMTEKRGMSAIGG